MDLSSPNPSTSNTLNLAVGNNDAIIEEQLLQNIDPNCVDYRGWTCLHEAAYTDNYECVLLIIKNPRWSRMASLVEDDDGHTALYLACKKKCSLRTITALLNSADDIANYGSTEGVTPLHIASSQGRVELIELLLEYGAIIDVQDCDGNTPLHDAVLASQNEALITLLYAGANPEIKNKQDCLTPFHLACTSGYYPGVRSLLPFVADINHVTDYGDSALTLAFQGTGGYNIISFLLENGADPDIENIYGEMAIDLALTMDSSPGVYKTLLSTTNKNKLNKEIILNACNPRYFKYEILKILLYSDLEPEFFHFSEPFNKELGEVDDHKPTYRINAPLNSYLNICANIYKKKSPEKFKEFFYLFLMRGVEVNASDVIVCPPLVYAHYVNTSCFKEVFQILIEHGCDVDYRSGVARGCCIPDAFLASLSLYPTSIPIMMPYSLHFEPVNFLQMAYKHGKLNIIPPQVQREIVIMIDSSLQNISAESLQYYVPSLKHLCRYKIRSIFRKRKGGPKSTIDFLSMLDNLPVPKIVKKYLRYIRTP